MQQKLEDKHVHKGLRKQMVDLLREKGITDESVLAAINAVPRHYFLDSAFVTQAYEDRAFPIGEGQTISHPHTVAYQTQLLQINKLDKVLVYVHEKDPYESSKTALSFLSNPRTVKFIDLSDTKCKGKVMLGGYHGITLTKCFANEDPRNKEIAKYLEEIKAAGFDAHLAGKTPNGLTRVAYGSYNNRTEAIKALADARAKHSREAWMAE